MPDLTISALGGTDHFLTEIRNVVKSKEDVTRLWNCEPDQIKILGIDPGQAFVIGASALLPLPTNTELAAGTRAERDKGRLQTKFFNLSVKQKAVYQPTFKHRRWEEDRKQRVPDGGKSIATVESELPPLHGPGSSIKAYVERMQGPDGKQLGEYYGNVALKKHLWNARKARQEEFRIIANRLLELVRGSLGAKRLDTNKVVIGIGLGDFASKIRLSSLDETFLSHFVTRVRLFVHDYISSIL